jgi:acetyl-CoA carboxylase biotin carboxyl carrier protein
VTCSAGSEFSALLFLQKSRPIPEKATTLTIQIVDLKDIKAIIDLMKKNSVSEFELEKQDFKIRLKRGATGGAATADEAAQTIINYGTPAQMATVAGSPPPQVVAALPAAPTANEPEIKSPMIGTFYRSPSPDSGPYVEVGTEVNPDTVVCIIEAMKVMNEIKAEVKGVITQALVENAKPVEFGQPLFKIRPS